MNKSVAKYMILNDYMQFQLALQNCYHDKARKIFKDMCFKTRVFREHKDISWFFYKKISKELRVYQLMYNGLDIRRQHKNWDKKAYLINKGHFG